MTLSRALAGAAAATALLCAAVADAQVPPPPIVVHRQVSVPATYNANAFWLESAQGIVLIDALMLKSDARRLVAAMKETGKPLLGIILTHPHLDHFGGIRTVQAAYGNVPIIATQATADAIKPTFDKAMADGGVEPFGDDFDRVLPRPDRIVASGSEIELGGMHFAFRDLGPMEAGDNTVIYNSELKALFAGDATVRGAWVYVGEGRLKAALEQLSVLASAYPGPVTVYSGHYDPGPLAAVVQENSEQVRFLLDLGKEYAARGDFGANGQFTQAARREMIDKLIARYPHLNNYDLQPRVLPFLNIIGMEREMAAARTSH